MNQELEIKEIKQCRRCAEVKPLSEFARKSAARDGLQPTCRRCARDSYVAHYKEHKERIVARNYVRTKRVRNNLRQFVWDYLLVHPCVDCGEGDPVVLEFDHVRGEKLKAIAELVLKAYGLPRLKSEIEKCEVRCANCHRRKTALEFGWFRPSGESEGP